MLSSEIDTLEKLQARLQTAELTSVDLVQAALSRIQNPEGQGSVAFTRIFADAARREAQASDRRRQAGRTLSLIDGLPISVKDLFDIEGYPTRAGSVVLSDAKPATQDALIVKRLREAGAIIIGTTNMTEFAYSGLGLNPHFGTPLSPWRRLDQHIAGGSSSGAAVSVADGMVAAAIGTDTGGSVRIPAAFCGLVGYKPTAKRIDMRGTLPLSTHLDSIGPIAHTVSDCAYLAAVMAGEPTKPLTALPLQGLRLGIPRQLVLDGMDESVSARFSAVCSQLERAGVSMVSLDLPELEEIAPMNAAGGFTAAEAWAWHRDLLSRRQNEYDPRVSIRIRRGEPLGKDYIDNLEAQRQNWIGRVRSRLKEFDALVMPTVPVVPPALAPLEADDDLYARTNLLVLRNPSVINFLDGCAISLPCHEHNKAPVGLMIAAPGGQDERILGIAKSCEALISAMR